MYRYCLVVIEVYAVDTQPVKWQRTLHQQFLSFLTSVLLVFGSVLHCSCLFSLLERSHCQILRLGHCPSFSALPDFEMDKYLGTWYQIERYFSFAGMGGKCWAQTYYNDPEVPGRFKLQMEYRDHIVENKLTTEMDIYQDMPDDPATLTSQMFGMPFTADDYQVLSTDYTNYAIEWRCEDRGLFQRRESLWILARTPFPQPWVMKEARGLVHSLGLKMSSLRPVSQDCHLPGRINIFHQSLKRKNFQQNQQSAPFQTYQMSPIPLLRPSPPVLPVS